MSTVSEPVTQSLIVDIQHDVAVLKLNRPERRNALSRDLLNQLLEAQDTLRANSAVRVVVLAASGAVFCSGHDLAEMRGLSESAYADLFSTCSKAMHQFRLLPQPVIARVQGLATAAGCQLAASCDLVVAAEGAAFATPGVKIGLFCTTPMVPLVRAIPPKVAMEMLLTGNPISAARAAAIGLVNRVVPADQLDATIAQYVAAIRAASPLTIQLGKEAFYEQLALAENIAYDHASKVMTRNALCHDAQEGISAFLGKRSPSWRGA